MVDKESVFVYNVCKVTILSVAGRACGETEETDGTHLPKATEHATFDRGGGGEDVR